MLFRDTSKPELIVEVPPNGQTPKAVVVLLGWFGSKLRHVRKYSALYDQRGCATITGSLDDRSLMFVDLVKIDEFAVEMAKEAAKLLRAAGDNNKVPLICHAFSNGGGIPLQRMEQLMDEKIRNGTDNDDVDVEDWKLIRDRLHLGAEIFDSAPAFPDMETYKGAVNAAVPGIVGSVLFCLVAVYYQTMNVVLQLQGKQNWGDSYWKHWESCPAYAPVQAYVYSTADSITKSCKLDELVKNRVESGVQVKVKRFDDSLHVQHMMKHKAEYCGLIDEILTGASPVEQ